MHAAQIITFHEIWSNFNYRGQKFLFNKQLIPLTTAVDEFVTKSMHHCFFSGKLLKSKIVFRLAAVFWLMF